VVSASLSALAEAISLRPEHFSATVHGDRTRDMASLSAQLRHRDAGRRYVAARTLARIDSPEAAELLEGALRDKCAMVRTEAIRGLTRWDPGAVDRVEEALTADRALSVRVAVELARHRATVARSDEGADFDH
jgi:HEAT repeat protein